MKYFGLVLGLVMLAIIMLLSGCEQDDNKHANDSKFGLVKASDTKVTCYRFREHEGIHCFLKKDLD